MFILVSNPRATLVSVPPSLAWRAGHRAQGTDVFVEVVDVLHKKFLKKKEKKKT